MSEEQRLALRALAESATDESVGLPERLTRLRALARAVLEATEEPFPPPADVNLLYVAQHLQKAREYLSMQGDGREAAVMELFLCDLALHPGQTFVLPTSEDWEAAIRKARGEEAE